ncbi:MAG: phosphatase [Firmicutes bacterium]|nr:phosphatase [Bacillota bacterium]
MNVGIVDLGSNTVRLSVYRVNDDKVKLLLHRKVTAGIASYTSKKKLSDEGIGLICEILTEFHELLSNLEIPSMHIFATASLRNIINRDEALSEIIKKTGLKIDVISGEEEAMLSFYGALPDISFSSGLMIDMGGGSTELLHFDNKKILTSCSLPVGSLDLFNRHVSGLFPDTSECCSIQKEVRELLFHFGIEHFDSTHVVGVGGTIRAICKISNHYFKRSGGSDMFTLSELREVTEQLKLMKVSTAREVLKLIPERIHTIVPGAIALESICATYGVNDITVSPHGAREGYLCRHVLGKEQK